MVITYSLSETFNMFYARLLHLDLQFLRMVRFVSFL